ncbi:S24 family peptidase [Gryllotalpicola reticulitermitis]|uniref:S24 family peptidase n=1 Tax=Gryllotalpicola reticulitermitis TaxID=1184153 RepID=A0ABV8QEE6_9MICO
MAKRMLPVAMQIIAALLLIVLAAPLGWRLVSGDYFMQVTGVSMTPTYRLGEVVDVQPALPSDLKRVGQVVIVMLPGDKTGASRYMHRVQSVTERGTWLKGDNNLDTDPQPVSEGQLAGKPRFALHGLLGSMFLFTQSVTGRIVLAGGALALLLIAPVMARQPKIARRGASSLVSNDPDAAAYLPH